MRPDDGSGGGPAMGGPGGGDGAGAPVDPLIGTVVGNYRVTEYLGAGGMGSVYLAEHARIGQKVAIKVLHADVARDPKLVRRFEDEARAAAQAGHRNIVQVFDFGELPDGRSFFVMERLRGRGLGAYLKGGRRLPLALVVGAAREIALALGAAHRAGIVHRDLKPDNVFITDEDADLLGVKVLDFGIAKLQREPREKGLTDAGTVFGTPAYMAPEQARGATDIDGRADLYALGVVMFQMLTGVIPFDGDPGEILAKHVLELPPDLAFLRPDVPPPLTALVMQLLRKPAAERPASAEELVAALDAVAQLTGRSMSPAVAAEGAATPLPTGGVARANSFVVDAYLETKAQPSLQIGAAGGATSLPRPRAAGESPKTVREGEIVPTVPPPPGRRWRPWVGFAVGGALALGAVAVALLLVVGPGADSGVEDDGRDGAGEDAKEGARDAKRGATAERDETGEPAATARTSAPASSAALSDAPATAATTGAATAAPPEVVLVKSKPEGAVLTLDGEGAPRGKTPLAVKVVRGEPVVGTLRLLGHADKRIVIDAAAGLEAAATLEATASKPPPRKPSGGKATARDPLDEDATLAPTF